LKTVSERWAACKVQDTDRVHDTKRVVGKRRPCAAVDCLVCGCIRLERSYAALSSLIGHGIGEADNIDAIAFSELARGPVRHRDGGLPVTPPPPPSLYNAGLKVLSSTRPRSWLLWTEGGVFTAL